jgi:outer membrane protein assembly factor BamB
MFRLSGALIGLIAASNFPSALASSTSELLRESWSYTYYYSSSDYWEDQGFSGIADSDGNLYWLVCRSNGRLWRVRQRSCSIRSTDFDGNLRYEIQIAYGSLPDLSFILHFVAGSVVVAEHNALLTGFDTSTGSVRWTHDLREEFPYYPPRGTGGMAHDGQGRIVVTANSSLHALSVNTGETIWRQDLTSEDPERQVRLGAVVFDESQNVYFAKNFCRPYPSYDCDTTIVSLDSDGNSRFEVQVDPHGQPIAVAHGRVLTAALSLSRGNGEVLDAETGARIARLPDVFDPFGLISQELGFFIQMDSSGEKALAAFELASGTIRWRYPLLRSEATSAGLFTDAGNILVSNKTSLLEISPDGQLIRVIPLTTPLVANGGFWGPLLLRGRWFGQIRGTVFAYDLPGDPGEGRLGWNSRHGNAQGENRPREE